MTVDKRISYVNQDGYKNYTKNSDSVTVPRKFKSRANATPTKLAYITAAEEKQLKKQNPGTPHKGPSGIPSYDDYDASAGRYGRSTSGQQMSSFESGAKNERARADARSLGMTPKEVQDIRAAAINAGAGQRVNPGFFDSKHTISPAELAMAKAYRMDPANKYAKQAYRNTRGGLMNFIQGGGLLGNLLSGLGSFFGLGKRYDEPTYDMSEGNTLGLYNERVNPTYYNDLGNEFALGTTPTPSGPFKYGIGPVPPSDPFKYSRGPQEVNLPGPYETAADDYWSDKQVINTPGGEIVIDSQGNEVVDMPTAPMGTPWDNPYQESKKSMMEDFYSNASAKAPKSFLENLQDKFGAEVMPAGNYSQNAVAHQLFGGNLNTAYDDLTPFQQGQVMDAINTYGTTSLGTLGVKDGGRIGYANGGLAALFTRRG